MTKLSSGTNCCSASTDLGYLTSPSFMQALFSQATLGMVMLDLDGRIEHMNPAALKMFGGDPDQLCGRPLIDLLDVPFRRSDGAILEWLPDGLAAKPVSQLPVQAVRCTGEGFSAEVSFSLVEAPGLRRLVMFIQDTTERVESERAASRAFDIMDATPDVVAWGRLDGRLSYVNRAGRESMGVDGSDKGIEAATICDLFTPSEAERCVSEMLATAITEGSWSGETNCPGPDDKPVPVSVVVFADSDEGYWALVARDLSHRREMERLKDAFISNVSHELRTPLTAIVGYLELVLEEGDLNSEQREMLDVVARSSDRLVQLVGSILTVSRIQRRERLRHDQVALSELVCSLGEELETAAAEKDLKLKIKVRDEGLVVIGDSDELRAALGNVIANAIKFTPPLGEVRILVRRLGTNAMVEVVDNGIGIPSGEQDKVFDSFYRATNAQLAQMPGTGLGLTIADAVVRRHGGTISVESAKGGGSAFRVLLPEGGRGSVAA